MEDAVAVPGAPGRPRNVEVRPVDSAAVVMWERPDDDVPVTRYEVTPVHAWTPLRERGVTVDGSAASALVRGLSNGATYTVRVTAWHDDQAGRAAVSPPFEPNPPPGAPEAVVADAGEQSATVRWTAVAAGGPVERYRVVATPADVGATEVPAAQTSVLVAGLRTRCRYTFTVAAVNGAGENVSSPSNPVWPGDDVPWYLFPLELAYLLVLGALAYLYALDAQPLAAAGVALPALRDAVPPAVAGVPVSIPWFGAVGAVMIGLYGIFDHGHRDWQRRHNAWHVARPFTGAVLGTVGFILFTAVIRATGLNPGAQDPLGRLVYFGVAFVIGFREETFRQLITRVADLVVGPGRGREQPSPRPAPGPRAAPAARPEAADRAAAAGRPAAAPRPEAAGEQRPAPDPLQAAGEQRPAPDPLPAAEA